MLTVIKLIIFMIFIKLNSSTWTHFSDLNVVENAYKERVLNVADGSKDPFIKSPICQLPEVIKRRICDDLFNRTEFKNMKIYRNNAAFYEIEPVCFPRQLSFYHLSYLNKENIIQEMFVCSGRHNPMHSDFILDDYFATFHISGDLEHNLMFVYASKKSPSSLSFFLHAFYINVDYENVEPLFIRSADIENDLQTLNIPTFIRMKKHLEVIYLREMVQSTILKSSLNPVCSLNRVNKLKLCHKIFTKPFYKNQDFFLDTDTFFYYEPFCEEKSLVFLQAIEYNKSDLKQTMLPCFGKYKLQKDSSLQNDLFRAQFYISSGPRPNSIIVYSQLGNTDSVLYHIYEFVQNIKLDNMVLNLVHDPANLISNTLLRFANLDISYTASTSQISEENYEEAEEIRRLFNEIVLAQSLSNDENDEEYVDIDEFD